MYVSAAVVSRHVPHDARILDTQFDYCARAVRAPLCIGLESMMSKVASVLACLSFAWALAGQQVQKAGTKKASCDCLEFAAVFYDNLASCGRASELYFLSKYGYPQAYAPTEPIAGQPHKVCADFFKNFKNSSCVNRDLHSFPLESSDIAGSQSWCYVSNDCLNLNGGTFATNPLGFAIGGWHNQISTSNLSWKICDDGADSVLRSKTVQELIDIGEESDVGMPTLLRLSFPAVSMTWGEAQDFMEALNDQNHWDDQQSAGDNFYRIANPHTTWGTRLPWIYATLGEILDSEKGWILDSPGHRDEFHVIRGREVWAVVRSEEGNMAYMAGKYYLEFNMECVLGCSPANAREAPLDLLTQ